MSLLGGLFSMLQGRIDHVPESDLQGVVDEYNAESASATPQGPTISKADFRRFEAVQVLYTTRRIVRQATPHNAPPIVAAAVDAATAGSVQPK